MNNFLKNKKLLFLSRATLGLIFIYASLHKIAYPDKFAEIVYGYGLLHQNIINFIAITVPFIELISGTLLLFNIKPKPAVTIINGLLIIFIVMISINFIRGYEFDCGCFSFSDSEHNSSLELLARDIIYLGIGIYIFLNLKKR